MVMNADLGNFFKIFWRKFLMAEKFSGIFWKNPGRFFREIFSRFFLGVGFFVRKII
jgi:hypothetical protein